MPLLLQESELTSLSTFKSHFPVAADQHKEDLKLVSKIISQESCFQEERGGDEIGCIRFPFGEASLFFPIPLDSKGNIFSFGHASLPRYSRFTVVFLTLFT